MRLGRRTDHVSARSTAFDQLFRKLTERLAFVCAVILLHSHLPRHCRFAELYVDLVVHQDDPRDEGVAVVQERLDGKPLEQRAVVLSTNLARQDVADVVEEVVVGASLSVVGPYRVIERHSVHNEP